ncbi:hypothetical protein EDD85DRAFT_946580 [Armillaria nabsnona]|nr:hypothetical protein EDD85DRAFT_946580 [Armillaria nabsnona]
MLSTLKTVLLTIYISISSALFGAACVIAIQFHYGRPQQPRYINQYNAHPVINYVLPQQPPEARIHTPVHNHELTEIHELPRLSGQQEENMVQTSEGSVSEDRITSHSGTPIIILSTTSSSTPYMVQGSLRRPSTPYPGTASNSTGNTDVAAATPAAFDPDTLWDAITPSAFIPPRERTPEIHVEDLEYPSVLDWDQPIPGSQYERIPFDESGAPQPYSQEPTPEPVARPFQPPRQQIIVVEGSKLGQRPRDWWPSETSTTTIATELLPTAEYLNGDEPRLPWQQQHQLGTRLGN